MHARTLAGQTIRTAPTVVCGCCRQRYEALVALPAGKRYVCPSCDEPPMRTVTNAGGTFAVFSC